MFRLRNIVLTLMIIVLVFTGCDKKENSASGNYEEITAESFNDRVKELEGTTVTYYGWGGSDTHNAWIDGFVADHVKEMYGINLKRVGMNIDEILNILLNEKQAGTKAGNIDIIWINGENFISAKENELLYGPFTSALPNFNAYVNADAMEIAYDFGYPVEGFEAPYGKAQFVLIYDSSVINKPPKSTEELLEWVKANPGKFTYPALPDFTGSAFVRNVICDIVGHEQFMNMEPDEEIVREAIKPAIEYLKEIKPYLWKNGETYPAESPLLNNMYSDKEVYMSMGYNPYEAVVGIKNGQYPDSTRTVVFKKGTVSNTNFLAIAANAPNVAGAMAVIDFILSPEAQASKYDPNVRGDMTVLDFDKLSDKQKAAFINVQPGEAALSPEVLAEHSIPEMPAKLVPIIEKIWLEEIPGSNNQ